jgi:hypothetical protein
MLALMTATALAGCGKQPATYELVLGSLTIRLPIYEDPKIIQDDIMAHLRPLWDGLSTGTSISFQVKRTAALDVRGPATTASNDNTHSATFTTFSPPRRFFKMADGTGGIEQLEEGKEPRRMLSLHAADWAEIDKYLRQHVITLGYIRVLVQDDLKQNPGK